jgi:hypothetical protein
MEQGLLYVFELQLQLIQQATYCSAQSMPALLFFRLEIKAEQL